MFLIFLPGLYFPRPTDLNKSHYRSYINFANRLNTTMLRFPQKVNSNIEKFEKANNLIINVYSAENKIIVPVRISTNIHSIYMPFLNHTKDLVISDENIQGYTKDLLDLNGNKRLVNLSLYENHFSVNTNLHRLISKQLTSSLIHNLTCYSCLLSFTPPLIYYHYLRFCLNNKSTKAVTLLPKPSTYLSFK